MDVTDARKEKAFLSWDGQRVEVNKRIWVNREQTHFRHKSLHVQGP